MKLIVTIVILHIVASQATNVTEEASANKTKRTIANQVQSYGENRPVLLYPDNSGPPTFYTPVTIKPVFDPEVPKQVAAQQVLYEFQQTPTNAVSNVHVNQFYQPVTNRPETPLPTNTGPAQFISGSETVAAPVQHSALIRHGQNFAQVQFQPQHIQTQQYVPGKYLYVNGKILYQPNQPQQQQQNGLHQRPVNFLYTHPQTGTQKFVPQVPLIRPMAYRRFHPPQPHQFQKITKPMNVPEVTEAQPEEEPIEENKEEEEAEDVEEEEKASEESNDDDDHDNYYSKYSFDDEDEDHGSYREEEDDDDNERGSSRPVPKKHKSKKSSKPNKYSKSNNYKFSENYSSSSKYDKPGKKGKKTGKAAPKMHYKSVKYIKEGNGKPRFERIEGKQSQNIPVIHKQKIFKEKWFVTKSTDDSITK